MKNEIVRLIYISDLQQSTLDSAMVTNILKVSRDNNSNKGIGGMLLFDYEQFLQVLEGPKDAVAERFSVIKQDKRHHNVVIIGEKPVHKRKFAEWGMGFSSSNKKIKDLIGHSPPSEEAALSLLLSKMNK